MKFQYVVGCFALLFAAAINMQTLHAQTLPVQTLPPAVADALTKAKVPLENVAVLVKEVGAKETLLTFNASNAMNPASVIKLVTTYAGLELLGPNYTWKTEFYSAGEVRGGILPGDLVLKGTGDPKLTAERLAVMVKQLRDRGLEDIQGDLILDRSFFENGVHDEAAFDGEALRAYNVGPDALLLNFKTVRFFSRLHWTTSPLPSRLTSNSHSLKSSIG